MPDPLGYPYYHGYPKPVDYVFVDTQTRTNLVFDSDTIGGATRIYLAYDGGPFSDSFHRPDGALSLSRLDRGVRLGVRQQWSQGYPPSPNYTIVNNVARCMNSIGGTSGLQSFALRPDNLDVSVTVSTTSRATILFRSSETRSYLGAKIDAIAGHVYGTVGVNDFDNIVVTGPSPVVAGTTYTLRGTLNGSTFTVYLDGVLQGSFTDTTVPNTQFSLGIWTDNVNTRFYGLNVTKATNPVANHYEVRNYDGDIVASGALADDHIDIPDTVLRWRGNGPYGWYRVYLTGPDHSDNQWQTAYGDCSFYRVRTDANFAANLPRATPSATGADDDEIARCVMVPTVTRISISSATTGTPATNNAGALVEAQYLKANWADLAYPTRPRTVIGAFGNGTQGIASTITATVALLKNYIKTWEPRNEPDYDPRIIGGANGAERYISNEFDYFRNAVKAGDPTARVIGPGPVEWQNVSQAGGQGFVPVGQPWAHLWWIQEFLQAAMTRGGTAYLDGVSAHCYNLFNGDLNHGRKNLSDLMGVVAGTGYPGPVYQTEQGYEWLSHGWERPRHAARWTVLQWFLCELYGLLVENNFYWYDNSHGFDAVPMWWIDPLQGPGPQVLPLRVMAAEIADRLLVSQFDFGVTGNQLYAGGTWSRADGSKTVGLMAASAGAQNVVLSVVGVTTLTCVDTWGNTFTLGAPGGLASFPISEMPQWIRCPNGVTVTPVTVNYGTNFALAATPSATGSQARLSALNNGLIENHFYGDPPAWYEYQDESGVLPQTITLDFGGTVSANRIIVHAFPPWQVNTTLTDFDIDTFDGVTWTTRLNHPAPPVQTFLFTSIGRCIYESFWDEQSVFDVSFPNASITKVRLVIRKTSYHDTDHPTLLTDIYGLDPNSEMRWIRIQDIQVFGVGSIVIPPPPSTIRNPAMGGVVR